jgi:soluble lytic murein transglycosylase
MRPAGPVRHPLRALVAAAVLCVALLPVAGHAEADLAAQRKAFVDAYRDAEAGLPAPSGGDDPSLVAYPLHPYVQAARLRAAVARLPATATAQPTDAEVRAFLARHGDEPVARLLRRPWLLSLAARRQWPAFLEAYAQARAPDQALRCNALRAQLATGDGGGLAGPAVAEWLTAESADDACDPVFDWLRARQLLTPDLVERRARLALAAGESRLARWLARSLPEARARPLREWALFIENPRAAVDALVGAPSRAVEDEALLAGWERLARRDPQAAGDRIAGLAAARPALASRLSRALALGLAWSRQDGASRQFERVAEADYDDVAREWRVRAALWAGDWPQVARAVAAMPAALGDTPRWRYWSARAAEATGDGARARELYAAIVPTDNWYAVLAAARLGDRFAPHDRPLGLDPGRVAALATQPSLLRARELFLAGLVPLAQSEWNAAYASLDPPSQRDALGLARDWGWHFQAIAAAAQQGVFDDYRLLYPTPYEAEVKEGARLAGLPATLVHAVIRQESLYQPWAVSSAGAMGLMQLLPGTARQTARALGRPQPTRARLADPAVNVALGSAHLAELVARFDGQVLLALAAYNAGAGAARRWLPEKGMEADVWVENIPYNETRAYVQRIMWHSVVFEWLEDGEPEDASSWLAKVRRVE